MAKVKVKLDHHGMAELLSSKGVEADLLTRGQRVASTAKATAPRDTGAYAEGIEAVAEQHKDRVVVHVGSSVDYAFAVEAKTGNLSRALDAAAG